MAQNTKKGNIIRFHRNFQVNIGIVIGVILLIYAIFRLFVYVTQDPVSVYEVTEGTLTTQREYSALALRSEKIITADSDGQLYFYEPDETEVSVKSLVYSLDTTGDTTKLLKKYNSSVKNLSDDQVSEVESQLSTFTHDYSDSSFSKVYDFKSSLSDLLNTAYHSQALSSNSDEIAKAQAADSFHLNYAPEPGLVSYRIDGMEDTTTDNFTSESLDSGKLHTTDLSAQDSVKAGQPVYKLIDSENWNLVMQITEDDAKLLSRDSNVEVTFKKDGASSWGSVNVVDKSGRKYLVLGFDDSMERYANERYLGVNIVLDSSKGLKIPNSAITSKKFFTIPKTYFYKDASSGDTGVLLHTSNGDKFVSPTIYYETDKNYYVDSSDLSASDVIIRPQSTETYTVGSSTASLKGVYCVNKGYAVFKQIQKLSQNKNYTIVDSNTPYGISLYDRIALEGDRVHENDIIH